MILALVLVILVALAYLTWLINWWPVLNDPDHYTSERTQDEIEHFRFFASLPKPDREWNR